MTSSTVFLIILAAIGANLLFIGILSKFRVCPPPKVEYRFIPRTFNEEQESPVSVIDQLQNIFDDRSILT